MHSITALFLAHTRDVYSEKLYSHFGPLGSSEEHPGTMRMYRSVGHVPILDLNSTLLYACIGGYETATPIWNVCQLLEPGETLIPQCRVSTVYGFNNGIFLDGNVASHALCNWINLASSCAPAIAASPCGRPLKSR